MKIGTALVLQSQAAVRESQQMEVWLKEINRHY